MAHVVHPSFPCLEDCMSSENLRPAPLRVKIKSLAAEARIIVREERRALGRLLRLSRSDRDPDDVAAAQAEYVSLRAHRREVVSRAAREALLAYGFLRGRAYGRLEPANSSTPNWDAVWKVAERFAAPAGRGLVDGERAALAARWSDWRAAAEVHRER
jgi:hypothetical protein